MLDIELAKNDVKEKGFFLSIVKSGNRVLQSRSPGLSSLMAAIEKERRSLRGASAADKVIGKAAAMLLVYSEVKRVYAILASEDATATLERFHIPFESEKTVAMILNRNRTSSCPFETLVQDVEDPHEAFERLRSCNIG